MEISTGLIVESILSTFRLSLSFLIKVKTIKRMLMELEREIEALLDVHRWIKDNEAWANEKRRKKSKKMVNLELIVAYRV